MQHKVCSMKGYARVSIIAAPYLPVIIGSRLGLDIVPSRHFRILYQKIATMASESIVPPDIVFGDELFDLAMSPTASIVATASITGELAVYV